MPQRLCPSCRANLSADPDGFRCSACAAIYPLVGGVELLMAEPRTFCSTWVSRLERYGALSHQRAAQLQSDAHGPSVSALTRERLTRLGRALDVEHSVLSSLFSPLARLADGPSASFLIESLVEDPMAVSRYSEHLFRDWVWGDAENARTLGLVAPLLPATCASLAVFGAGTARLALELAREGHAEQVYALDINPLPLLVTDHLLGGAGLTLPEFPQFPVSAEHVAVWRSLSFAGKRPPGLKLVLADALAPPFADGSFQAVLTPWFIDDVPADVADSARAVNRCLADGGTWINVGPLQFGGDPSRAYSIDEVHELVGKCGFALEHTGAHDLPYFESPVSSTCRIDRTYVFSARKTAHVAPAEAASADAPRASVPSGPIPLTARIQTASQRAILTAGIASLVDGRRTLPEIAEALARDWNVGTNELMAPLAELLARLV